MLVLRTAGILLSDPQPSAHQKNKRSFDEEQQQKNFIGKINLVNAGSIGKNNLT